MSSLVSAQFTMPDYNRLLQRSLGRIQVFTAAQIQTQIGLRFASEGAYNGHEKWAPLKYREGQILALTGALKNSMAPQTKGKAGPRGELTFLGGLEEMSVVVGTLLAYAAVHNNGAVIKHPGSKDGFGRLGKRTSAAGKKYKNGFKGRGIALAPHDTVIPKRNWTDMNEQDTLEITEALTNLIERILNGE